MAFVPPKPEELAAVARLRPALLEKCNGVLSPRITDTCILRFYRGFKGKEDVALEQLAKHQEWRVTNNVDNIHNLTDRFQKPLINGLSIQGPYDKKGRPVSFIYIHKHNANDRDIEEFKMFIMYVLESLVLAAKPDEERFTIVMDMGRFSMSCMDYEAVKSLVSILQTNYTDTLENLYVIDAPMLFSACWAIIRPWIDPITAAKVNFIRRSKLTDYFDADQIPGSESGFNSARSSAKYMSNSTKDPSSGGGSTTDTSSVSSKESST